MPGTCQMQASMDVDIAPISPAFSSAAGICGSGQLSNDLVKCNLILNRQTYNLQEGIVQVGGEFFSRPCFATMSRQAVFPPFVFGCFCHADLQRSPLGSQHFFIKTLEVFRLLVANMLRIIGCSNNLQ